MVRYFAYIDTETIEELYNQLNNCYDKRKVNKGKIKEGKGELGGSIKNIILGFLDGDAIIRAGFREECIEEIERANSIENKIKILIEIAKGNEKKKISIEEIFEDRTLICGEVEVMECKKFLKKFSKKIGKKVNDYTELQMLVANQYKEKWNKINKVTSNGNGLGVLEITQEKSSGGNKIFSFVVVNSEKPIRMDMSYRKITIPHSDMTSSMIFSTKCKFCVLGLTNKENEIYSIKPLALWNIVSTNDIRGNNMIWTNL